MKKTVKNSIIYFAGTVSIAVFGLASTMILTRFLDYKTYAMYGLLSTSVTAIITILSLGYDAAYTRFFYENQYGKLAFLIKCLKIPLILFLVFIIILFEPNQSLIRTIFEIELTVYEIVFLAIYILFALIHRFSQLTARMDEHAFNYTISNLIAKCGFLVVILFFIKTSKKVTFSNVLISFAISSFVSVITNIAIINDTKLCYNRDSIVVSDKTLIKYGFPYVINNSLILFIPVIERLIIRDIGGWDVLSLYTAATIFTTVIAMITNMIENIWQPMIYKSYHNEDEYSTLLHTIGLTLSCLTMIGLALCILFRRWIVLILDMNYFEVYVIAPIVLYSSCLNLLTGIYGVGINIKKKTIHLIISPIIQILLSVIMCKLLIPAFGLKGIGLSVLVSTVFSRVYRIIVGLKLYGTKQSEMKFFFLMIICIIVSIAAMYYTSLIADIFMFLILILLLSVTINKEIILLRDNIKAIVNK